MFGWFGLGDNENPVVRTIRLLLTTAIVAALGAVSNAVTNGALNDVIAALPSDFVDGPAVVMIVVALIAGFEKFVRSTSTPP